MLELHDIDLRQTRFYRKVFADGEARGEARGRAESLKRLLTRRFGPLPDGVAQRINGASIEQLMLGSTGFWMPRAWEWR